MTRAADACRICASPDVVIRWAMHGVEFILCAPCAEKLRMLIEHRPTFITPLLCQPQAFRASLIRTPKGYVHMYYDPQCVGCAWGDEAAFVWNHHGPRISQDEQPKCRTAEWQRKRDERRARFESRLPR